MNVWREVRRRFLDNQQEIMKACKEMKSLSLQKEIKESWGKEPRIRFTGEVRHSMGKIGGTESVEIH